MDIIRKIEATEPHIIFKQSMLPHAIALISFTGLSVGFICWHHFGNCPLNIALIFGGFMGLFVLYTFSILKKTLAPSNWLLTLESDRISIKFRSYLNAHFPDTDPQIVRLPLKEIESARITKQRITQYGFSGRRQTAFHTFLDLNIPEQVLSPLQEQLKHERNMEPPLTGKFVKSRSKSNHYPVSVAGEHTIRIEWRSPHDQIHPNVPRVISLLADRGIKIDPLSKEVLDMTLTSSDKRQMEDRILFLAQRGDVLSATKLARQAFGMNLTDAKNFVEELTQ
jgi:hypothetical protein